MDQRTQHGQGRPLEWLFAPVKLTPHKPLCKLHLHNQDGKTKPSQTQVLPKQKFLHTCCSAPFHTSFVVISFGLWGKALLLLFGFCYTRACLEGQNSLLKDLTAARYLVFTLHPVASLLLTIQSLHRLINSCMGKEAAGKIMITPLQKVLQCTQHKRAKLGMLTTTSRAFSNTAALPKCISSNDLISEDYFLLFIMSEATIKNRADF